MRIAANLKVDTWPPTSGRILVGVRDFFDQALCNHLGCYAGDRRRAEASLFGYINPRNWRVLTNRDKHRFFPRLAIVGKLVRALIIHFVRLPSFAAECTLPHITFQAQTS